VIKDLTGCPWLSGLVDVLWESKFAHTLDVKLGA
jgi:hypothetical protein